MKKVAYFVVLVFFSFFKVAIVNGAVVDAASSSKVGGSCSWESCWYEVPIKNSSGVTTKYSYARGMRVSLIYTEDGSNYNRIESANIFRQEIIDWLETNHGYYYWSENRSKIDYIKNNPTVGTAQRWDNEGGKLYDRLFAAENLEWIFSDILKTSLTTQLGAGLNDGWDLAKIWENANSSEQSVASMWDLTSTIFGLGPKGSSEWEKLAGSNANQDIVDDLWIVIEPITIYQRDGKVYVGSNYELSTISHPVSVTMRKTMPCSIMATGAIMDSWTQRFPGIELRGADLVNKTYFNGKLKAVSEPRATNICKGYVKGGNNTYATDEDLLATSGKGYGYGVGIIKFDPNPQKLDCKTIESSFSPTGNEAKLAKLLKDGKYQEAQQMIDTNMFINGLSYTDGGKVKLANLNWYLSECSCLGVENYYKSKTGNSLFTSTKKKIEEIFANQSSIFQNYQASINAEKEKNPYQEIGKTTLWTNNKYEAELKCPMEKATCQSVDFKKLQTGTESCTSAYTTCTDSCRSWLNAGLQGMYFTCLSNCSGSRNTCLANSTSNNNMINACKNMYLYKDNGFTSAYVRNNSSTLNECFKEYQKQFGGTQWNVTTYQADGCVPNDAQPPVEKKYNCTPQYGVGVCSNKDKTYYSDKTSGVTDEDYWKYCVFNEDESTKNYSLSTHKESTKTKALTFYDKNISNTYTDVYCVETLSGNFDASTITVKAGKNFTWNNHTVSGSRTCKTKSINYDKFASDLTSANQDVINKYSRWQLEVKLSNVSWSPKSSTPDCASSCDETEWYWTTCPDGYEIKDGKQVPKTRPCEKSRCVRSSYKKYIYYPSESNVSVSINSNGYSASNSQSLSATCGGPGYSANPSTYKTQYENARNYAAGVVDDIKQSYNEDNARTWSEYLYRIDPKATLTYSDKSYEYKGELESSTYYSNISSTLDCVADTKQLITSCSGNSCYETTQNLKKCKTVTMTKSSTTTFSLENGLFTYINKANNMAFVADGLKGVASYNNDRNINFSTLLSKHGNTTFNYINLYHSNLPVAYKTPDGRYGNGNGQLSVSYSGLGYKLMTGSTAVDTILQSTSGNYGNWSCEFNVVSELIPDDNNKTNKDINVIYRPISLDKPFPGMEGNGRNTGSNWCDYAGCSEANSVVNKVITNNRGVKTEEVYSKEPMYVFNLTPSLIKEIRRYNAENSYTAFSGSLDNKSYDYVCEKGTGRNCKSGYLTHLIELSNAIGSCTASQYRSANSNSDICRYLND